MTKFTPEVWLLASRIAYPNEKYIWDEERGYVRLDLPREKGAMPLVQFNPYINGDDYRALREALDKEFEIVIYWSPHIGEWDSVDNTIPENVPLLSDKYIVNLMMRNVKALREAGVVE